MDIKPIKTKKDHQNALKRVEKLWSAKAGSKAGDELDVLVTLIEYYEKNNYPIGRSVLSWQILNSGKIF